MADTRFLSFDEVLQTLNLTEDELHDLVAANELRAFRVNREMKFKEEDVKGLKLGADAATESGEVISLDESDIVMVDDSSGIDIVDIASDSGVVSLDADDLADVEMFDEGDGGIPDLADEDDGATVMLDDSGIMEVDEFQIDEDDNDATQRLGGAGMTEVALEPASEATEPVLEPPTSDGLGTEEIIFEDEDLALGSLDDEAIGTQEITVQEMAVGSEELTVQGEAVSTQPLADVGAPAASRRQGRMSARVSGRSSVRRASLQVHAKKGDWLWAGFLVSTSLMMIMPVLLIITVSIHGFVAGNETFVQGDMKHEGKVPEFGSLFVHKFFKGFCEYTLGTPPTEPWAWWGFPSHPKQLPIDAEEVEDKPAEGGGGDGAEPAEDGGEKTDEAAEG